MSEELQETTKTPKRLYKLSDDVILMLRELIQYSLLMNTNLIDNFRALRLEQVETLPSVQKIVDEKTGNVIFEIAALVPAKEYVESYNRMIEDLDKKLQEEEKAEASINTSETMKS